ncbi:hypothetical protein BH11PAT1_BH11PAT1_1160 [soil metagenome]
MKTERLILSFIAVLVGLLVAGIGFYIYQMTSKKPAENTNRITLKASPTISESVDQYPLSVDSPSDEMVIDKKTVSISGKTGKDAVVVISTGTSDQVVKATTSGNFTATQTIDSGTSTIRITSLFPDGQERHIIKTITYSTESF